MGSIQQFEKYHTLCNVKRWGRLVYLRTKTL